MPKAVKLPIIRKTLLPQYSGVKHVNGDLIFPDDWAEEVIRKVVAELDCSVKQISELRLKAFTPSDQDKTTVKGLMKSGGGKEYKIEEFGFFEIVASQTKVDMQGEITTKALLEELAVQYKAFDGSPGKTLLINHGINSFAGACYDAVVRPVAGETDVWELAVKVYITPTQVFQGNNVLDMVNCGVISKASAGFRPGNVEFKEKDGKSVIVLDSDPTGTRKSVAIELSLAYQGAVEGARVKTEGNSSLEIRNLKLNNNMSQKSTVKVEINKHGRQKTFNLEVTGGDSPTLTGQQEVVTYIEGLHEEIERLKKAETDSKKPLSDKIISLQKKLKTPEDTEAMLLSMDYPALDARVKYLEAADKRANPKNQVPTESSDKSSKEEKEENGQERKKSASFWDDDENEDSE